jgi:uncharacterized protein with von Willebrand factor type A (vWA) domain
MSDTDVPDFVSVRDHVRDELVRFTRALRRAGAHVPANASTTGARALVQIGFRERERVKSALRACFITEQSDRQTFDALFPEFWRRLTAGFDATGPSSRDGVDGNLAQPGRDQTQISDERDSNDRQGGDDEAADDASDIVEAFETSVRSVDMSESESEDNESVTTSLYSPTGQRTEVSTPAIGGGNGFENAFRELSRALGGTRSRRWQGGGDERSDVRRALRESIGTGGTVLTIPRRERKRTTVRCHLLVDVSRSVIDVIDRSFLVRFLRRARADWYKSRVFFFDDRLREVTEAFTASNPQSAIDALERAETEWGGGTRIGGSIERLRTTAPNAIDRRTIVLIISDGLEMGDVSDLERELSKLSRRAKSVYWLNPLATSDAYEPTASGMAAALPFIDGLFAFAGPSDIAEIANQLHQQSTENIGYEFDTRLTENE